MSGPIIDYERQHRYVATMQFARGVDVLDVACGDGSGASLFATVARSVCAFDIDAGAIADAAARHIAMNLSFFTGAATSIPLADASVDLVVSLEAIERHGEDRQILAEFRRVLRGNGRLVMSVPNKAVARDGSGLYFDRFRDLVREFFPISRILGQRSAGGSAIYPLHGAAHETNWLDATATPRSGIAALPDPEYFFAICSLAADGEGEQPSSFYLDAARVSVEQEPPALRVHLDEANERLAEALRERELLLKRIAGFESARLALKDEVAAAMTRVAMLENVRIRLHEGNTRLISERNDARAEAQAATRELEQARARIETLDRACGKLREDAVELRIAATEAERSARESLGHLALAQGDVDTLQREASRLRDEVAVLRDQAVKDRRLLEVLFDAQVRVARVIADYERSARRAEADRAWMEAAMLLDDERKVFADVLALREQRIATLETALRGLATDILRATEVEREHYHSAHRELLSNRLVRGAVAVKAILRRVAAARRAIAIPSYGSLAASTRRKAIKKTDKAKRHLRSA